MTTTPMLSSPNGATPARPTSAPPPSPGPTPTSAGVEAPAGRALRAAIWLPGLAVALGAAVATAHGLYEVAVGARVPAGIAWLYPLITDGLALVAYAATARLRGAGARYAWAVVVLAAGLSGLAQAVFLAGDPTAAPAALTGATAVPVFPAPPVLRFGVGAWPAIAAAIVAHLLYLLATADNPDRPDGVDGAGDGRSPAPRRPALYDPVPVQPFTPNGQHSHTSDHPGPDGPRTPHAAPIAVAPPAVPPGEPTTRPLPSVTGSKPRAALEAPARERARAAAHRHAATHGAWPTVTQLMALAEVSRGTAGEALKTLRNQPAKPSTDHDQPRTTQP